MGLSASQARLLSITARLSDNELHSQQIANAKIRLADQTQQASADYIKALDSSKLVYTTYDANGEQQCVDLTPGLMYTYSPLKNQYAMMTPDNKIMVSAQDAVNYENTNSLGEFLECYGIKQDTQTVEDKATKIKRTYKDVPYTYYEEEISQTTNPDWEKWHEKHDGKEPPKEEDFTKQITVHNWTIEKTEEDTNMYDQFRMASKLCYDIATDADRMSVCYVHVLASMIDLDLLRNGELDADKYRQPYKNYNTSINETVYLYMYDVYESEKLPYMLPVSNVIRDGYDDDEGHHTLSVAQHPYNSASDVEEWQKIVSDYYIQSIDINESPMSNDTKLKLLLSNYQKDSSGNLTLKTLKQKCVDMLYVNKELQNLVPDSPDTPDREYDEYYKNILIPYITSFQQDMEIALKGLKVVDHPEIEDVPDKIAYDKAKKEWDEPEPDQYIYEPKEVEKTGYKKVEQQDLVEEVVATRDIIHLDDENKAQWYVNLWNAMNGSDTANLVKKDDEAEDPEFCFVVTAAQRVKNSNAYKVLEDNLMSSASWLQFAIKHGIITLSKAEYYNPSADSNKALEITSAGITWQSIALSSAVDIHEVDDERAIAKAEAEYTKKLNEIEAKDKKYDNDIKKLDTEHNALKTEYESVQNVITKNVDRSFKAFS